MELLNEIRSVVVDGCGVVTVVTGASVVSATERLSSLVGEGWSFAPLIARPCIQGGKRSGQPTESLVGRFLNSRRVSLAGNIIAYNNVADVLLLHMSCAVNET